MPYKYVGSVVRPDVVAPLQMMLSLIGVRGITLSRIKGIGETRTSLSGNWLADHTRLQVFEESDVEALLAALRETAFVGVPGAGLAAVMSVDTFEHLRASGDAAPDASP